MGIRAKRKLFKVHESSAVVLPSNWVSYYGKRVDVVTIIGGDLLLIVPEGLEQRAEEVAAYIDSHAETTARKPVIGGFKP